MANKNLCSLFITVHSISFIISWASWVGSLHIYLPSDGDSFLRVWVRRGAEATDHNTRCTSAVYWSAKKYCLHQAEFIKWGFNFRLSLLIDTWEVLSGGARWRKVQRSRQSSSLRTTIIIKLQTNAPLKCNLHFKLRMILLLQFWFIGSTFI